MAKPQTGSRTPPKQAYARVAGVVMAEMKPAATGAIDSQGAAGTNKHATPHGGTAAVPVTTQVQPGENGAAQNIGDTPAATSAFASPHASMAAPTPALDSLPTDTSDYVPALRATTAAAAMASGSPGIIISK